MAQTVLPANASTSSHFVSTSLYVGDLATSVTEAQLFELFSQVGQVVSVRVCRDLITKKSLGYAYVNYNNVEDASQALELLNFTSVNGKSIRIMYSHRDPSIRKNGSANIFIKNLDKEIDNKALHDIFSVYGPILSCRVALDESGNSKGHGFVQFEQEESAQKAIENVNGLLINDKQVFVGPFHRKQERDTATVGHKFCNLYVKNIAENTTDENFLKIFEEFGSISSAVIMRDSDGKSKGFGFVNFDNSDDAAKAVESLNGKWIDNKEWYVGRAQKKAEREAELKAKFEQVKKERTEKLQGANLYLKNIDDRIDDEKLQELFSVFGTISSCKIMKTPQGQSTGSGFVSFSTPEEAARAVKEMNGKMVGNKPLYVALAQKKEDRRARLEAQFAQTRNTTVNLSSATTATSATVHHPVAAGIGQQVFYSQPHSGLVPSQENAFGYQNPIVPGMRPNTLQLSTSYFTHVTQRPGQQSQHIGNRRSAAPVQSQQYPPQQAVPGNYNRTMRSTQSSYNASSAVTTYGVGSLPVAALASALASAPPEEQRMMLGEQLYPLVEQYEHDHAGKVTGMLLELDQPEVLHLIESPDALKAKVAEAMEVLQMVQANMSSTNAIDQISSLSLNEPLAS